ncbi:MAG: short chain dehydrogenase/reductase family oxidoreductase [Hyphomicrobiales bacterium]|nr:short chain dehydrogenase/reductase family oxidoreductase [Hyphomicrobiales bacterium]
MDLGIRGRKAIVCASSRGLGRACAMALAEAGCEVVVNGVDPARVEATANDIARATGAKVIPVAADVGADEGRALLLAACPDPDILVNNNSGPPPRDFRQLSREDMVKGLDANMMTPILLVQKVIDAMVERRFGRIVNITSGSVKMPMTGLDLSSGARAGLTSFLAGVARQVAASNVTINNILPGPFETDRLKSAGAAQAKMRGVPYEELQEQRKQSIPARRFGQPEEFGALCAFVASAHAGYMTGQNFLIDGGAYPSAF